MDNKSLAKRVLYMLHMQELYFRTREFKDLKTCKALEAKLKEDCKKIVNAKDEQPTLFDPPPSDGPYDGGAA